MRSEDTGHLMLGLLSLPWLPQDPDFIEMGTTPYRISDLLSNLDLRRGHLLPAMAPNFEIARRERHEI